MFGSEENQAAKASARSALRKSGGFSSDMGAPYATKDSPGRRIRQPNFR